MADVLVHEKEKSDPKSEPSEKNRPAGDQAAEPGKTSTLVDEHGEPFSDEFDRAPHGRARKRPLYKRPAFLISAVLLLLIGAIFLVRYWQYARSHESTDDAFIDGHIIQVSTKASGYVAKIYVTDNQQVKAGDLLAELDARDYEAKLDQTRAALAAGLAQQHQAETQVTLTRATSRATVQQASAGVRQARSSVAGAAAGAAAERARIKQSGAGVAAAQANADQAGAELSGAQAEATRANADVTRYQELYAKDEISRQRLDAAVAAARTADAQVDAAKQKVTAMTARVNEARASESAQAATAQRARTQITGANLDSLRAAVQEAELQFSYTKIYAPEAGRVTRRAVETGALVQVGQPLLALVPGDVWVTANYKESQIGIIRPGQPVEINVDAYPDKTFKGHVDSLQAGTGARFSLIPAENATGNYVKVVQRVPVKIVFDEPPDPQHLLAPGMSVVPSVKVK